MKVYIEKVNDLHIKVTPPTYADRDDLSNYFSFMAEGYKYHPKYKYGKWDGKIRLYNKSTGNMYFGLFREVTKFFKDRKYQVVFCPKMKAYFDEIRELKAGKEHLKKQLVDLIATYTKGKCYKFHNYQLEATAHALTYKKCLIQSPTSSGKSFIIFGIVETLRQLGLKTLIIVPKASLVGQMAYKEFVVEYGGDEKNFHQIFDTADKETEKPITVSTWQGLINYSKNNPEYFKQFQCVIVDEAHEAEAKSITKILDCCINAEYKMGFSGSYKETKTSLFTLEGMFGSIHTAVTVQELIANNTVSDIMIKIINLRYTKSDLNRLRNLPYREEIDFLAAHEGRNKALCQIMKRCDGNILLLSRTIEHMYTLKGMLEKMDMDKEIHLLTGKNTVKQKDAVIARMEENSNCITLATYSLFSTGVNVKNLPYIMFGLPMKSMIKVVQSIGRGLRKHKDKDKMILFDVIDHTRVTDGVRVDKLKNTKDKFSYLHGLRRLAIYDSFGYNYKIKKYEV